MSYLQNSRLPPLHVMRLPPEVQVQTGKEAVRRHRPREPDCGAGSVPRPAQPRDSCPGRGMRRVRSDRPDSSQGKDGRDAQKLRTCMKRVCRLQTATCSFLLSLPLSLVPRQWPVALLPLPASLRLSLSLRCHRMEGGGHREGPVAPRNPPGSGSWAAERFFHREPLSGENAFRGGGAAALRGDNKSWLWKVEGEAWKPACPPVPPRGACRGSRGPGWAWPPGGLAGAAAHGGGRVGNGGWLRRWLLSVTTLRAPCLMTRQPHKPLRRGDGEGPLFTEEPSWVGRAQGMREPTDTSPNRASGTRRKDRPH